jgi:hypothetical protein
MIDNIDKPISSMKKDNCYMLMSHNDECALSSSQCLTDLSTENKINICFKLINTILEDGKTYRSNIELLQQDNSELRSNIHKLKLEVKQSVSLRSTDPSFKEDTLFSLKNQLKSAEKQSDTLTNALKNYCRISPIGRVKYTRNIYYYIWRFKTFSNYLLIEKRQDEKVTSDWYQIKNTKSMIQILNKIQEIQPNKTDLIRG